VSSNDELSVFPRHPALPAKIPRFYVLVMGSSRVDKLRDYDTAQVRNAVKFIRHPNYRVLHHVSDIALIKVQIPILISTNEN
jgi:hypothetical protein